MAPKRRRWLTAFLFVVTALGGVLAYLLARRARRRRETVPEKASVAELSARLRHEAARRVQPARRRAGRLHWPWSQRRQAAALSSRREGDAFGGKEHADEEDAAGDLAVSVSLRTGQPDDAAAADLDPSSGGGTTHDREDPLAGT